MARATCPFHSRCRNRIFSLVQRRTGTPSQWRIRRGWPWEGGPTNQPNQTHQERTLPGHGCFALRCSRQHFSKSVAISPFPPLFCSLTKTPSPSYPNPTDAFRISSATPLHHAIIPSSFSSPPAHFSSNSTQLQPASQPPLPIQIKIYYSPRSTPANKLSAPGRRRLSWTPPSLRQGRSEATAAD